MVPLILGNPHVGLGVIDPKMSKKAPGWAQSMCKMDAGGQTYVS